MPAPGDQHSRIGNPFEDVKPRISEYTAQEIATLQSRLERQLGPEYLSSRSGPSGQKVHYIAAEKVIALANEVFGFNGWSSSIQNIQVDFVDEHPQTLKISLGLHVVVRVTLRDGTFHEDIGYGHIENCKGKAAAFEKAKKEGTTDALKRALRNFGNVLGNCIYDKTYLAKVTKLKVEATKFDEAALHRHADFAVKKEATVNKEAAKRESLVSNTSTSNTSTVPNNLSDSLDDLLGEFDEADFGVAEGHEHPDEVVLDTSQINTNGGHHAVKNGSDSNSSRGQDSRPQQQQHTPYGANQRQMQPPSRPMTGPGPANAQRAPHTPQYQPARPGPPHGPGNQARPPGQRPQPLANNQRRPDHLQGGNGMGQQRPLNNGSANQTTPLQPQPQSGAGNGNEPVAFFSARAVPRVAEEGSAAPNMPISAPLFNPKAESPSIRKTPGIDHNSSRPVGRNGQHVSPVTASQAAANDRLSTAGGGVRPVTNGAGPLGHNPPRPPAHQNQVPQQQHQPQQQQQQQQSSPHMGRGNIMNPQMDHARRIGAPMGAGSPLSNRGQYKPPTMTKRPPLADIPNGTTAPSGGDAKRVKLG